MQTLTHTNTNPIPPKLERRSNNRSIRVHHWRNLTWWIILISAIVAIVESPRFFSNVFEAVEPSQLPMSMLSVGNEKGIEKEAFIALAFGKISATHELAISKSSFKAQLEALKEASYSSVRLEQINQWKETNIKPLPSKPVLLTFEEANRETMGLADKILAKLGMTALVFVDVNQLNQGNITLVSWHKLEALVKTGRWEVGISGCLNKSGEQTNTFPKQLSYRLLQERKQLESTLGGPVVAANCSHSWHSDADYDALSAWNKILADASLQIGFVAAPFGANYHKDPKTSFRRIRVSKKWNEIELLTQIKTHQPRRAVFSDTFRSNQLASDWVVDSGKIIIENDMLRMTNVEGEQGAMLTLGGTEKWQDAEVEVQLKGLPEGQFWISLRYGVDQPFIRLGIANDRVLLQETNGIGKTKQLASGDVFPNLNTLKLRVVGGRVIAYYNGQALTTRPVELESSIKQGAFTLTVWKNNESFDGITTKKASVDLIDVKARPVFSKNVIVKPVLKESEWTKLRQQAEQLSGISPRYFAWIDRKPQAFQVSESTMEIFTRYYHLQFLPALFISSDTPFSDASSVTEQALEWASNPKYHGLNIILKNTLVGGEWRQVLDDLSIKMAKIGKTLSVTVIEDDGQFISTGKHEDLFLVSAKTDLLTSAPRFLYPLTKKLTDI
jgi:peptidoglycan/xylan/chitin deacetylase (PgdA/CDA1 family)